jgi:hypothetical protein
MSRDLFDPTPEEQIVVLVDAARVRRAEKLIESCEGKPDLESSLPKSCELDATATPPDILEHVWSVC